MCYLQQIKTMKQLKRCKFTECINKARCWLISAGQEKSPDAFHMQGVSHLSHIPSYQQSTEATPQHLSRCYF